MDNISDTKGPFKLRILSGLKKSIPEIIGMIAGGIGGYIYYGQIGCSSGTCAITSNPWMTILWGGLMGYLVGGFFNSKNNKNK